MAEAAAEVERPGRPRSVQGRVGHPAVYSIAAHRGFADALVAGLISRYGGGDLGLARVTVLLPNRRAVRTVTEAFVRAAGALDGATAGLMLPRMAVVGDLDDDGDSPLGPLLDPLEEESPVPAAADGTRRWLRLASLIALDEGAVQGAALLRRAHEAARTIDRLAVEGIAPEDLLSAEIIGIVGEQAGHWQDATRGFLRLHTRWRAVLAGAGEVDPPTRRNMLFDRLAAHWRAEPPQGPVIAAGITSASPALARLLRVISALPQGAVVLPDLDLALDDATWAALGRAGMPDEAGGAPFGRDDALTHPQYHLKLLLARMGIARGEVRAWHRAGMSPAPSSRSAAISNLFLPPVASARWVDLDERKRRLSGVRLMESAHPAEEAQAIALLMRQVLETPERRVALVTPDRGLGARVVAHLRRWGVEADDTAGQPLSHTAAGRLLLLLAEIAGEGAPPVPLIAALGHPLVRSAGLFGGKARADWLDQVRALDLKLRGPRPGAGLAPIATLIGGKAPMAAWWGEVSAGLAPLLAADGADFAGLLGALATAAEALCGDAVWAGADGRAVAGLLDEIGAAAAEVGTHLPARDLAAALRDAMDRIAVRPPWGGHPRVSVLGLLEARMARADLVICGGLVEGVWPAPAAPDPLLPPAVLRQLGVPAGEFRIGLAAHDLAAALGAPQVVLSWARRDEGGPVMASRFVLRVQAMLGKSLADKHFEREAVEWARAIDVGRSTAGPARRPQPMPSAEQRRVSISATALDRLRGDPFQFYAASILGLSRLDALDAAPGPAWRGSAAHDILDQWHQAGATPGALVAAASPVLDSLSAHPLARVLWRPRLLAALAWIDSEITALKTEGRAVLATEQTGAITRSGIRIHARADRIDRLADGGLAVVDYKSGTPPSARRVEEGFALQLGLIALIAREGGFENIDGEPTAFEYWSLSKKLDQIGYRTEPLRKKGRPTGLEREVFIDRTADYLDEALARWILGDEPFTARLNPDLPSYTDYDQLMRLDEWIGSLGSETAPGPEGAGSAA